MRIAANNARKFLQASLLASAFMASSSAAGAPVKLVDQDPVSITKLPNGGYLLDFGRVAFGNLRMKAEPDGKSEFTRRCTQTCFLWPSD